MKIFEVHGYNIFKVHGLVTGWDQIGLTAKSASLTTPFGVPLYRRFHIIFHESHQRTPFGVTLYRKFHINFHESHQLCGMLNHQII
ncbi:unnamed protein product [Ilex paraguariensis]|uniref:Uncharacterized protein n=1 Tax=Ilex paraguariensis TaxID=185542 RepID=A0ABC8RDI6_9AQUA